MKITIEGDQIMCGGPLACFDIDLEDRTMNRPLWFDEIDYLRGEPPDYWVIGHRDIALTLTVVNTLYLVDGDVVDSKGRIVENVEQVYTTESPGCLTLTVKL